MTKYKHNVKKRGMIILINDNQYLSAVDAEIKKLEDNATIGLLLCKSKNNLVP